MEKIVEISMITNLPLKEQWM